MAQMSPGRRRMAILIVVIGGIAILERGVALTTADSEVVAAAMPKRARSEPRGADAAIAEPPADGAVAALRLDRLTARRHALAEREDAERKGPGEPRLFDAVNWQPPAPKVAGGAPPPAPKPVAPPFPYAYMGSVLEDGVRTVFFTKGDRVVPMKAGDTVDAAYRIDDVSAQQMKMTYIPLNEAMVLALGGGR